MRSDKYGQVILTENEIISGIYSGKISDLSDIFVEDDALVEEVNQAIKENFDNFPKLKKYQTPDIALEFFDEANQCEWFMPEEYQNFPMEQWLLDQCKNDEEKSRVKEELELFIQHGMFDLLFYLKYLVDTMRKHNIVWGVGRGSSVASYVLYLIGVHKINSIKYKLDIKEFLR